ncbi:hypothetical protein N9Y31_02610 [Alphaproteobacteria bacterium]|nr:hypothetical protein [Alphaproteobacteria bacterium]
MIIHVVLNSKLISCDSIIPVCMEIKSQKPHAVFMFYCESGSHKLAVMQNKTLHRAIISIGELKAFGELGKATKLNWFRRPIIISQVLSLIFCSIIKKSFFVHFRKLDYFPYSLIKSCHRNKTILFESSAKSVNSLLTKGYGRKPVQYRLDEPSIVGFSSFWFASLSAGSRQKHIQIPQSFLMPAWNNFLNAQAEALNIENHWLALKSKDRPVVVIILGPLGALQLMREDAGMINCLRLTIKAVQSVAPDSLIVMKPHPVTDMNLLTDIINEFNGANIEVEYFHPGLLAKFADVVICNAFSTSMTDAHASGATTVEFSDYSSDMLKLSKGLSVEPEYIDYFINRDFEKLSHLLRVLLGTKVPRLERRHLSPQDFKNITKFIETLN